MPSVKGGLTSKEDGNNHPKLVYYKRKIICGGGGGMFYRGRCKAPTAQLHKTSSGWTNYKNSLKINCNTICQAVYEIIQEIKHATNHLDLTG